MTFTHALPTNNYGTAKFIVSASAANGTHTTIASAIASASAGDTIFIRAGTYTEDITLKADVNLTTFGSEAVARFSTDTANVTIVGKITASAAGDCTLYGLQLKTNSDFCLVASGSTNVRLQLINCFINASNNTAISITNTGSSLVQLINCFGDTGTTGIAYFAVSGTCGLRITGGSFENNGNTVTASTNSSSTGSSVSLFSVSYFGSSITTSNNGALSIQQSSVVGAIICGSTGSHSITETIITSGTASAISVSAGATCTVNSSTITSTNTNPISGAGIVIYSNIDFLSTGILINTTTQTAAITRNGVTMSSLQPAFLAYQASAATNATGDGTNYQLGSTVDLTEVYDQASNFDPATGVFTAPYTGKYHFDARVFVSGGTAITQYDLYITTTSRNFRSRCSFGAAAVITGYSCCHSVDALMTAGDTALVTIGTTDSGGKVDDVYGDADSWTTFSGYLIC